MDPKSTPHQLVFYTEVLTELYQSIYGLVSPGQFKDCLLAQHHQQWRLKRANNNFIRSYNNLLSLESKDGNSINVRKFANSDLSRFWSGYMAKALRAQETVERLIVKADELVETVGRSPLHFLERRMR